MRLILALFQGILSLSLDEYHNLDTIEEYLSSLSSSSSIGTTSEGRSIYAYQRSAHPANNDEKTIGVGCGFAARDWASISTCLEIIQRLEEGEWGAAINWLVLPLANPDGYKYTWDNDRQWSKNRARTSVPLCQGVDITRNFPHNSWDSHQEPSPCSNIFPGEAAASEAETQAIIQFLESNQVDAFITVTTNGESIEYPFNYDGVKVNNFNDVDTLGRKMAREMSTVDDVMFTYRQGSSDAVTFGTIEDYLVEDLEVLYVYKIKMRGDSHLLPTGDIEMAAEEVFGALSVLQAYLIKPYYPNFRNIFDYISWDDGAYGWMVYDKKVYDGFDFYTMNLTSQQWLTEWDTDRPLWWHTVCIAVPHEMDPEMEGAAFLAIDGGFNQIDPDNSKPIYPESNYNALAIGKIAKDSGAIAANIYFVPNQRIKFLDDWDEKYINKGRAEDQIIALTWKYFVHRPGQGPNTDEPHWLLRYPMVKAAVKAMDAVSEWNVENGRPILDKWCATGASKRGWTTWMVGAVDPRINCLAPMVETFVGMEEILHGHFQALGGWSFAFDDYYREELTKWLDSEELHLMAEQIDPISYKENLTMPIYVIQSAGDEFFLPSDTKYFFDKLPGDIYLRLFPNAEHEMILHGLSSPHVIYSHIAFFMACNKPSMTLPKLSWGREDTDEHMKMRIQSDQDNISEIELRHGQTRGLSRLDWRLARARYPDDPPAPPGSSLEGIKIETIWWPAVEMTDEGDDGWVGQIEKPDDHYAGLFGQVIHDLGENPFTGLNVNFTQTTIMNQWPEGYPNEDCHAEECLGTLV